MTARKTKLQIMREAKGMSTMTIAAALDVKTQGCGAYIDKGWQMLDEYEAQDWSNYGGQPQQFNEEMLAMIADILGCTVKDLEDE